MNKVEYLDNILSDGQCWIDENIDYYDSFDSAYDDMELDITGNANGSYYCNAAKAAEAVSDVIWDGDIVLEVQAYGYNGMPTELGPETCDVLVRIALLPWLYNELEDYFNNLKGSKNVD